MDVWTGTELGLDKSRLERIGDHLQRHYIEPEKISGCEVLVARRGQVAYHRCFGLRDRERGLPWTEDTICRIYSMTKPIVSVALMSLIERGLAQLSDPVARFFPAWSRPRVWSSGRGDAMETVPARRPVSIRDVLTHTGGLTYGGLLSAVGAPESADPVDEVYAQLKIRRDKRETLSTEFMDKLAKAPLRNQPGTKWQYSLSSDVCGALIETISGRPLDVFFQEEIFAPLGMSDTAFWVPDDKIDRFAACYRRGADKRPALIEDGDPQASSYRAKPVFFSGGGGLAGTVRDYLRFCEMLRLGGSFEGHRILGPRTIDLMVQNHLPGGQDLEACVMPGFSETSLEGVGFGLGFAMTLSQRGTQSHGAADYYWGGAASTIFWIDPQEDLVVIFATQLIPSATFNFRGQLKSLVYASIVD